MAETTPYVFISYASSDRERMLEIVDALRDAGITCWLDEHDIAGGANWGGSIADAIEGCIAVVLMSSTASLTSRNVRQEIALAWQHDKPYVPLRLDAAPIPNDVAYWLATAQWIEVLDHPADAWLPKVEQALLRVRKQQSTAAVPPASDGVNTAQPTVSLPSPPSSFVGREREVAEIAALLHAERIVTLVGPGGIGKTRVAIAVGHRLTEEYADGVVFVDLSPLHDPTLILPTIAASLGVRESGETSLYDVLLRAIRSRHLLLILDNLEQVIEAAGDISRLISACPSLAVLATSREPLRIGGEVEYTIAPLQVPDERQEGETAALRENPAITLFVQRARATKPGFDLTSDNATTIIAICNRLDGLPLAIELAAARVRALSPQVLLERLNDPLRLLTGGARDLPDRQRTIRDTIQWSFDLLTPDEQRLLCRLSVFAGGWTLDTAEAVVNVDGRLNLDVLDGLISLADKSLITRREQEDGDTRFGMLATIREFARERLDQSDALDVLCRAHAEYFLRRLEALDPDVHYVSRHSVVWYADEDHSNILAAVSWALDHDADRAGRMIITLYWYWSQRGQIREALTLTSAALSVVSHSETIRCRLLGSAANFMRQTGDYVAAIRCAEEGVAIARDLGDPRLLGQALGKAGVACVFGNAINEAKAFLVEALPLCRAHRDWVNSVTVLTGLSLVSMRDGDYDRAVSYAEDAVAISRDGPEQMAAAPGLVRLAEALTLQGESHRALRLYREALAQPAKYSDIRFVIVAIERVAAITSTFDPIQAVVLLGATSAARHRAAYTESVEVDVTRPLAGLRETLDANTFSQAWERGQQMSLDDARALSLEQTDG